MTKGDKKITTVYVSEKLIEKAKAEGINISEVLNNVLQELLEDSRELDLMKLEEEIRQLRQQLITLEMKRQQLLKIQAERQKERNREAKLYHMMTQFLKLKEIELKVKTEEEQEKARKLKLKMLNEIYKVSGVQKGTSEFYTFSKLLNAGNVDGALNLVRALWKK